MFFNKLSLVLLTLVSIAAASTTTLANGQYRIRSLMQRGDAGEFIGRAGRNDNRVVALMNSNGNGGNNNDRRQIFTVRRESSQQDSDQQLFSLRVDNRGTREMNDAIYANDNNGRGQLWHIEHAQGKNDNVFVIRENDSEQSDVWSLNNDNRGTQVQCVRRQHRGRYDDSELFEFRSMDDQQ